MIFPLLLLGCEEWKHVAQSSRNTDGDFKKGKQPGVVSSLAGVHLDIEPTSYTILSVLLPERGMVRSSERTLTWFSEV